MRWFASSMWVVSPFCLALSVGACHRAEPLDGTPLYAPFNQRKPIAVVAAVVEAGGYEIVVRSLMHGRLALRLDKVDLLGAAAPIGSLLPPQECLLGGGDRVRLANAADPRIDPGADYTIEIEGGAIPLDDPGRSIYREWEWLRRPGQIEQIDAELARLDALAPCAGG